LNSLRSRRLVPVLRAFTKSASAAVGGNFCHN